MEKIHAIAQMPEQRQLKTPQRGFRRAAGPGERLYAVQVVEKEFGEACFVLQHAGDKLVNVETAVEGDAAERQRQRNGFRAAQVLTSPRPPKRTSKGVKGCKAPLRLERLERAPLATAHTTGFFREDVQHQAGFAPRTAMQDKGALPSIHVALTQRSST